MFSRLDTLDMIVKYDAFVVERGLRLLYWKTLLPIEQRNSYEVNVIVSWLELFRWFWTRWSNRIMWEKKIKVHGETYNGMDY